MTQSTETVSQLTRPIIGIENRTAQEVFDIMCDRIDHATRVSTNKDETIAKLREALVTLEAAGSRCSRLGASTGTQWMQLSGALIIARSALTSTKKEG